MFENYQQAWEALNTAQESELYLSTEHKEYIHNIITLHPQLFSLITRTSTSTSSTGNVPENSVSEDENLPVFSADFDPETLDISDIYPIPKFIPTNNEILHSARSYVNDNISSSQQRKLSSHVLPISTRTSFTKASATATALREEVDEDSTITTAIIGVPSTAAGAGTGTTGVGENDGDANMSGGGGLSDRNSSRHTAPSDISSPLTPLSAELVNIVDNTTTTVVESATVTCTHEEVVRSLDDLSAATGEIMGQNYDQENNSDDIIEIGRLLHTLHCETITLRLTTMNIYYTFIKHIDTAPSVTASDLSTTGPPLPATAPSTSKRFRTSLSGRTRLSAFSTKTDSSSTTTSNTTAPVDVNNTLVKFGLSVKDKVLESFSCALYSKKGIGLTHGRMYITQFYLAFQVCHILI